MFTRFRKKGNRDVQKMIGDGRHMIRAGAQEVETSNCPPYSALLCLYPSMSALDDRYMANMVMSVVPSSIL